MAVSLTGQIATALKASTTITSLVPATSIWSEQAPEGTTVPRILIKEIEEKQGNLMGTTRSLNRISFQVDCYAAGKEAARDIGIAVKNLIEDYTATYDTNNVIRGIIDISQKTVIDRNRPSNIKPVAKSTVEFLAFVEIG